MITIKKKHIMKNFIEFVKKYKIHILSSLLFIFFLRSCIKSGQVRKIEKVNIENIKVIDSLVTVTNNQKDTIIHISDVIRKEKIKVHNEYDNYISKQNRGEQLMKLHMIVKNNIKELQQ